MKFWNKALLWILVLWFFLLVLAAGWRAMNHPPKFDKTFSTEEDLIHD